MNDEDGRKNVRADCGASPDERPGWHGTYDDGEPILAGDEVLLDGRYRGRVVACIDNDSYLPGEEGWSYLGGGVMIDTDFTTRCVSHIA